MKAETYLSVLEFKQMTFFAKAVLLYSWFN